MIRRPPRSTLDRSSAASDVYKRQDVYMPTLSTMQLAALVDIDYPGLFTVQSVAFMINGSNVPIDTYGNGHYTAPVSYTHLRAHETVLDLVCRLLLEKKKQSNSK